MAHFCDITEIAIRMIDVSSVSRPWDTSDFAGAAARPGASRSKPPGPAEFGESRALRHVSREALTWFSWAQCARYRGDKAHAMRVKMQIVTDTLAALNHERSEKITRLVWAMVDGWRVGAVRPQTAELAALCDVNPSQFRGCRAWARHKADIESVFVAWEMEVVDSVASAIKARRQPDGASTCSGIAPQPPQQPRTRTFAPGAS